MDYCPKIAQVDLKYFKENPIWGLFMWPCSKDNIQNFKKWIERSKTYPRKKIKSSFIWIRIWISKIQINPWFPSSNTLKTYIKVGKKLEIEIILTNNWQLHLQIITLPEISTSTFSCAYQYKTSGQTLLGYF